MKIPDGMTEEEVLDIIRTVTQKLIPKFKFGFFEAEDMHSEAYIFALPALEKYDPEKGSLASLLYIHLRNRFYNLRRNRHFRPDLPCYNCPLNGYDPYYDNSTNQCTVYDDLTDCKWYKGWFERNSAKRSLMDPAELSVVGETAQMDHYREAADQLYNKEIIELIDRKLSPNLRKYYIKLKAGDKIPKPYKDKLVEEIQEIMSGENDRTPE